jgi:hypothetical protein
MQWIKSICTTSPHKRPNQRPCSKFKHLKIVRKTKLPFPRDGRQRPKHILDGDDVIRRMVDVCANLLTTPIQNYESSMAPTFFKNNNNSYRISDTHSIKVLGHRVTDEVMDSIVCLPERTQFMLSKMNEMDSTTVSSLGALGRVFSPGKKAREQQHADVAEQRRVWFFQHGTYATAKPTASYAC